MPELYLLFESAAGYVLTHVKEWEQIAQEAAAVQEAIRDASRFGQVVEFKAFHPFRNAQEALENMQAITNGDSTDILQHFLEQNLPKKKNKCLLGVCDPALGKSLASLGFAVQYNQNVLELIRGCRLHLKKIAKQLSDLDLSKFQVGLGHSYSRTKIQFDPNRQDKPIMQSIALVDSLDKNINTFAMRVREWYCWHFPELGKIITDNQLFCKAVKLIRIRDNFTEEQVPELVELLNGNEDIAREIIQASKMSMGQDIVESDMVNIEKFAHQVIKLSEQRQTLGGYLGGKLDVVAPNLKTLVGDTLAARLISHAGSLVNLAKYPASTIQILGAEKALFRALKTKGNTPKYGLLFQSSFIGRAAQKNKGRISRYVANKCSLAARIDNFNTVQSNVFGEKMRQQVEDRLKYLTEGLVPRKNLDVMREAMGEYEAIVGEADLKKKKKKKKKKALTDGVEGGDEAAMNGVAKPQSLKKKRHVEEVAETASVIEESHKPKKKKKAKE